MIKTFRAHRSWVQSKSLVAPNIVGTPFAAEAYKPPKEQVNFSAFPAHNEISKPHKLKYSNIFLTQSKITFNSRNSNNKNDQIGSTWQIGHFEFLWDVLLWEQKHGKKNWKFQHSLVAWPPTGGLEGDKNIQWIWLGDPPPSQKWVVKPFVKVWTLSFSTTLRLWQLFNKMRKKICILSHWKKVKK